MIYESHYWKDELAKSASSLRRRTRQRRWPEASLAAVEKTVMIGCYSVRKLIEAHKLSEETVSEPIRARRFRSSGADVNVRNNHRIWQLYDLECPEEVELLPLPLCHMVVHSYVFMVGVDEVGGLDGVYLNSDRTRHQHLFYVSAADLASFFELVGSDYPASVRWVYNGAKRDYDVRPLRGSE